MISEALRARASRLYVTDQVCARVRALIVDLRTLVSGAWEIESARRLHRRLGQLADLSEGMRLGGVGGVVRTLEHELGVLLAEPSGPDPALMGPFTGTVERLAVVAESQLRSSPDQPRDLPRTRQPEGGRRTCLGRGRRTRTTCATHGPVE